MNMLAYSVPLPPAGSEWPWLLNALMWLFVFNGLGGLALIMKKLVGRQPSLNQVLSGLVTVAGLDDYKKEQHLRNRGIEEQVGALRHEIKNEYNSASLRAEERRHEIAQLRDQVSRLSERTETHVRKLDQMDGKIDRIGERLGRAPGGMK